MVLTGILCGNVNIHEVENNEGENIGEDIFWGSHRSRACSNGG